MEITKQSKRPTNAIKHGITAELVPSWEQEAFNEHAQKIKESVDPQNYLEEQLANRAALALWRLNKVAQHEAALVSSQAMRFESSLHSDTSGKSYKHLRALTTLFFNQHVETQPLRAIEGRIDEIAQQVATLKGLLNGSYDIPPEVAFDLSCLVFDESVSAGQIIKAMTGRPAKKGEPDLVDDGEWPYTPDECHNLGKFMASQPAAVEGLLERLRTKSEAAVEHLQALQKVKEIERHVEVFPHPLSLEKIARYEAHLERVLYRALSELEAAKKERAGEVVSPPIGW